MLFSKLTLTNFVFSSLSVVAISSGTLLAAGILNPWTTVSKTSYVDAKYLRTGAKIEAALVSTSGSVTEDDTIVQKPLQVRVTLPAGAGSLTEETRYTANTQTNSALPQELELIEADKNWNPAASESEGVLKIESWDRTQLKGKLFNYDLTALPVKNTETTSLRQ